MSFDKARVLRDVQSILEKVTIPGTPTSLVKAGCVQRIIAHGGEVSLILRFPPEMTAHRESLKRTIEDGVAAIADVKKVQILEKLPAGEGEPTAATQAGPNVAGREVPGIRRTSSRVRAILETSLRALRSRMTVSN